MPGSERKVIAIKSSERQKKRAMGLERSSLIEEQSPPLPSPLGRVTQYEPVKFITQYGLQWPKVRGILERHWST